MWSPGSKYMYMLCSKLQLTRLTAPGTSYVGPNCRPSEVKRIVSESFRGQSDGPPDLQPVSLMQQLVHFTSSQSSPGRFCTSRTAVDVIGLNGNILGCGIYCATK